MRFPRTLLAAALGLALLAAGAAAAADTTTEPGYVDLEWIAIPDGASEFTDIDLSPMLMSFAKDARENADDAMLQALAMVRSLRVKEFSVDEGMDASINATIEKLVSGLKKKEWKRLIYVKSDTETVSVHTRYVNEDLVGLMLVAYEPGDSATFVNVVGDLDLATLMKLAGEMDTDSLEELMGQFEGREGVEIHHGDADAPTDK